MSDLRIAAKNYRRMKALQRRADGHREYLEAILLGGTVNVSDLAKELGVSRHSLYQITKRARIRYDLPRPVAGKKASK